ncbi:kinase-like domain-containing protein [Flammula alnicola]|nr:kinase-like domain-containing protein [Flammula alnicola]
MRKLVASAEVWDDEGYQSLSVVYTEGSNTYIAQILGVRDITDSPDALNKLSGNLVPVNHIYPVWLEGLTEVQQPIPFEIHVKTPLNGLVSYNGDPAAANSLLAEVAIYELISKNPHPNVCTYHGCIRAEDRVMGLCIQKYTCSLSDVIHGRIPEDQCPPIDADSIISGIETGLDHIHSLGLVHDDISPSNIMLDDAGNSIIIDFNTCVAIGAPSVGGTPGWSKWHKTVASIENDTYSFDLVVKFIRGEYDGQHYEWEETSPQALESEGK